MRTDASAVPITKQGSYNSDKGRSKWFIIPYRSLTRSFKGVFFFSSVVNALIVFIEFCAGGVNAMHIFIINYSLPYCDTTLEALR